MTVLLQAILNGFFLYFRLRLSWLERIGLGAVEVMIQSERSSNNTFLLALSSVSGR